MKKIITLTILVISLIINSVINTAKEGVHGGGQTAGSLRGREENLPRYPHSDISGVTDKPAGIYANAEYLHHAQYNNDTRGHHDYQGSHGHYHGNGHWSNEGNWVEGDTDVAPIRGLEDSYDSSYTHGTVAPSEPSIRKATRAPRGQYEYYETETSLWE